MRRLLATLIAAVALTVTTPPPAAFACSCVALSTSEAVEGADAVFLGTAAAEGVHVDSVYKGMLPSRLPLDGSPAPCSSDLVTGEQYVVFATWHAGTERYSTDPCAGTAAATPALVAEVARVAGDGRPPYDVPGGLPDDTATQGLGAVDGWTWVRLAAGAAALLAVLAGALLEVRANRVSG